jgi:hypothetical protein
VGFDSLFFFGWIDSISVGSLVYDVPLRWSRVSPRVVVRQFQHARDDPPPAKVPGGREVDRRRRRSFLPAVTGREVDRRRRRRRRRSLLPVVTGEASTTYCRVSPAQTNPRRREGDPRR